MSCKEKERLIHRQMQWHSQESLDFPTEPLGLDLRPQHREDNQEISKVFFGTNVDRRDPRSISSVPRFAETLRTAQTECAQIYFSYSVSEVRFPDCYVYS